MGTRVWLFGAVWLIAGALFCCGTSAQTIEINTVGFDNSRKTFSVTERFDRCPQHNFRNNFYHALTCAGFVRAHMDDLERKLKNKTVDWNADIDEKLAENVDKPCYDNAQFKVFYYDENQLIFLRFGEHGSHVSYWITENLQEKYKNNENDMTGAELYPYRNMRYFNQMYNRHIIMSFNFPLPGNVQSKKYAVIVYKADEEDRKLVEQKKGVAITMLEPCYIRDYYDDQDAVDIAVRIRMEKLQPVKEKFTSSTHLNAVSFVSLIAAGFVFYV
ncbi:hypothetical protein QR680_006313 [Steinernema hermaphroditum]|uniref:Uncharacterized protein n=1 Tax=Steinernema hermaphroditum TaxID=289476 RepID=A0AA39LWX9_9BILA|nr:hypothetical protein QR680_006313 [Steinernema hermaphroditum]